MAVRPHRVAIAPAAAAPGDGPASHVDSTSASRRVRPNNQFTANKAANIIPAAP